MLHICHDAGCCGPDFVVNNYIVRCPIKQCKARVAATPLGVMGGAQGGGGEEAHQAINRGAVDAEEGEEYAEGSREGGKITSDLQETFAKVITDLRLAPDRREDTHLERPLAFADIKVAVAALRMTDNEIWAALEVLEEQNHIMTNIDELVIYFV